MAGNGDIQSNQLREARTTDSRHSRTSRRTRPQSSNWNRQSSGQDVQSGCLRVPHPDLQNALPERPQYSLAGNPSLTHWRTFVDPRYQELNPSYQRVRNTPVGGLAKPLPRVVRPGMRKGRDGQEVMKNKGAAREEPGSAEPISQLGMIDDQRLDVVRMLRMSCPIQRGEDMYMSI